MFSKLLFKLLMAMLILVSIAISTGCQLQTNNTSTEATISYLPVVQSLPLFVAIEEGYFDEFGIKINAIRIDSPNLIVDSLLSGRSNFSVAAASGIVAISEQKNPGYMKIFGLAGGDKSITNDLLLVRVDSEIKNIEDLRGKKIGIIPGIQFRTILNHILTENNLKIEEDVEVIELAPGLQIQALDSYQVDALLTLEPMGTVAKLQGVGKELIDSPMVSFISDPWYGGAYVVNTAYAKENIKETQIIINALGKAAIEIENNPDKYRKYMQQYMGFNEEVSKAVNLPTYKFYPNISNTDLNALESFIKIFVKYEIIDKAPKMKDLLFTTN